MKAIFATVALVWLVALDLCYAQFVEVPPLKALVTDQVGILSGRAGEIEANLRALKEEKGSEVAVLVVKSTKPETIEQYSIRVVEKWKLGREGVDDGALLLVAIDDRAVRIEVGRGLEGDLPDAKANRIIDEQIIPFFKAGEPAAGVSAGVNAISAVIKGMELPPPVLESESDLSVLPGLFFLAIFLGVSVSASFGRGVGTTFGSIFAFAISALATTVIIAIPFAIVCGLAVLFIDPTHFSGGSRRGGRYSSGRGGFDWGGGFGGGFGGGGFGGGGTFSGGGASGRW
jgi:uncharacterized protein